jgi:hypothetical protein
VKRNRFIQLSGGTRTVVRELEAKARAQAGIKGYVTNLRDCPDGTSVTPEFVIGSIEACLTIVFAALAISRWIEGKTGWSIRKFVRAARRYRAIEIQAGPHTITAADPLRDDLRHALEAITRTS